MSQKSKVPSIVPLHYKYQKLERDDIPHAYNLFPIPHKIEEIGKFEIIIFHRILKKNYGKPSDAEFEVLGPKETTGKIWGLGKEWRYFVKTPSGGIIQIGTEGLHNFLKIYHVVPEPKKEPDGKLIKEGEQFVADLLKELDHQNRKEPFDPLKQLEDGEGVQLYLLWNIYWVNYHRAELMLHDAEEYESYNAAEATKYPAEVYKDDPEKMAYINKYIAVSGMYYCAAILYYFMALEGFVNLLYHAFLKDELKGQDVEQRLERDLELRVLIMPSLCDGFKNQYFQRRAEIFRHFNELKKYRNEIVHSKIMDAMKNVGFIESGFLYWVQVKKTNKDFLPSYTQISKEDVLKVKNIVDGIIREITSKMDDRSKRLFDKFILRDLTTLFWRDKDGKIRLGEVTKKEQQNA
jgi:hypothetical protein